MLSKKIFWRHLFAIFAVFAIIIFSFGKTDLGKKIIPTANASWENLGGSTNIYPSANTGINPSMAVDTLGRPHVVWQDRASGVYEIYYLYWNGAAWVDADGVGQESVEIASFGTNNTNPVLALDTSNRPHVAWQHDYPALDIGVFYLYWDGAAWVDADGVGQGNVDVSLSGFNSRRPSLALDNLNRPHLAWEDDRTGNFDIYYLYWDGAAWVDADGVGKGNIDIVVTPGVSAYASLDLDGASRPHIAWMDDSPGNFQIYYLYWNGAAWVDADGVGQAQIRIVATAGSAELPSLALNGSNNPCVSWHDDSPGPFQIYYLYWNGAAWVDADGVGQESISIYTGANASIYSSLKLDAADQPHIAFQNYAGGIYNIYYLYWNGAAWVDVDGVGQESINISGDNTANRPVLGLDNTGSPKIVWMDTATGIYNIFFSYWGNPVVATKLLIAAEGQAVAGGAATPTSPVIISGSPSDQTAGTQSGNFYVYAVDNANNLDVTKNSAVSLNSTDPTIVFSPAGINLVGGIGSFRATFNTVGNQTVGASVVGLIPVISPVINVRSSASPPPVQPPQAELKADINAPDHAIVGELVTFDGSGSTGNIVSYDWDFDDGGGGSGVGIDHIFSEVDYYQVSLMVRNNSGQTALATHLIQIFPSEEIIRPTTNPEIPIVPPENPPGPREILKDIVEKMNIPLTVMAAIGVYIAILLSLFTSIAPGAPALFSTIWQEFARIYLSFIQLVTLRSRRRQWGVIYDSQTKKPILKAAVQLFDQESDRLRESVFTDREGRFGFLVDKGTYKILVSKWGYTFPSRLVMGGRDNNYDNVYRQGPIKVSSPDGYVALNIPLDPQGLTVRQTIRYLLINKTLRFANFLRWPLLIFGTSVAITAAYYNFSLVNRLILVLYLLFWLVEAIRLLKIINYGLVKDAGTHRILDLVVLRIFGEDRKLVKTTVTDYLGRYNFFVEKGEYSLTASKPGFESFRREKLDGEAGIINESFSLRHFK